MAAVIFLLGVMVTGVSGAGWAGAFRYPDCGGGKAFFQDFAKCDASVEYCFEYRNSSCVGGCCRAVAAAAAVVVVCF